MTAEVKVDVHEEVSEEVSSKCGGMDTTMNAAATHQDLSNGNANGKDLVENGNFHGSQANRAGEHTTNLDLTKGREGEERNIDVAGVEYPYNGKVKEEKVEEECKPNEEVDVQNQIHLDHGKEESAELTGQRGIEMNSAELNSETVAQEQPQTQEVVIDGSVSDENGAGLPLPADDHAQDSVSDSVVPVKSDKTTSEQNGSSQQPETISSPVVCENILVESAEESLTAEISLKGNSSCPEAAELKQSVEPVSCPVADIQSKTEIIEGLVSDENGEGLPAVHTRNKLPGSDLVDANQDTPEQNGYSDIAEVVEVVENLPMAPVVDAMVEPEVENETSAIAQDIPASADVIESESEAVKSDLETCEIAVSHPVDCINIESEVNCCPGNKDAMSNCPDDDINTESKVSEATSEGAVSQSIPVNDTGEESHMRDSVENENSLAACPGAEVKSEPEIDNAPAVCSGDIATDETVMAEPHDLNNSDINQCGSTSDPNVVHVENGKMRPEVDNGPGVSTRDTAMGGSIVAEPLVLNGFDIGSEKAPNSVPDPGATAENGGIHLPSIDIDDKSGQETKSADVTHREKASTSSPEEGSTVDALEKPNVGAEVGRRPFNFIIKVPRYEDENLREKIKYAELQVEQKTQNRDAVRVEIQKQRANCKECGDKFEAAKSEERAARDLLKSKRQEIDSVQSVINKVKNAMSVEDIDVRLRNLEHMIEHETLPLKEEKQLIREIKQLKQHHEQLSSNIKQDEVQQALSQKDQIDERLKVLRKEADSLRANVLKAETVTQAAKKKYYDESDNLSKLQAQFKVADEIRQQAYTHVVSLKKILREKSKYHYQYRDDLKAANDLVVKGDRDAIQRLCVNQVERFMKLWNNNDEFRKEYIRCNMKSTLRRLKTIDGRSLGPNEEPPVILSVANERMAKDQTVTPISTSEGDKQEQVAPAEADKMDDKTMAKVGEQKIQTAKSKKAEKPVSSGKPASSGNVMATVSGRDDVEEAREEEHKRAKEEEELALKAEELRKEEEAAKLKEQRRLEEKAKAKEALERKKRNAEKAQARAAMRAQKEAEQKEKEREKRLRKKEKRKVGAPAEDVNVTNEVESAPILESLVETPKESESKEKPTTTTKKPQKPSQFTKQQSKAKSIPPPLRNRGKRRMQSWMWVLLAAVIVFGLFLLGNSSFSFKFGKNLN